MVARAASDRLASSCVVGELEAIRAIAQAVRDPELEVVNLGDLGVVRDIRREDGIVVVEITPTYSACPASLAIELAVEATLLDAGHDVRVHRILAPAWTTDWITKEGRDKLKASGIAPPLPRKQRVDRDGASRGGGVRDGVSGNGGVQDGASRGSVRDGASGDGGVRETGYFVRERIACPRCESTDTQEISAFGSTACKAQHRCLSCLEPFDYFKCL